MEFRLLTGARFTKTETRIILPALLHLTQITLDMFFVNIHCRIDVFNRNCFEDGAAKFIDLFYVADSCTVSVNKMEL